MVNFDLEPYFRRSLKGSFRDEHGPSCTVSLWSPVGFCRGGLGFGIVCFWLRWYFGNFVKSSFSEMHFHEAESRALVLLMLFQRLLVLRESRGTNNVVWVICLRWWYAFWTRERQFGACCGRVELFSFFWGGVFQVGQPKKETTRCSPPPAEEGVPQSFPFVVAAISTLEGARHREVLDEADFATGSRFRLAACGPWQCENSLRRCKQMPNCGSIFLDCLESAWYVTATVCTQSTRR